VAEVIWTEPALNTLDEIADTIALDDHDAACRLVSRIFEKTDLLQNNPKIGNVPRDLRRTPYRRLVIPPVYLYYRIDQNKVIVVFVERAERDFVISRFMGNP
jgi:toxin ParE1/3/4